MALALLVGVWITGGFVLQVGGLRLSVHSLRGPAAIAILAWSGAAILVGIPGVAPVFASLWGWLERRALAVALLGAAVAAGVGIGFGTHAASGADAAGYLSQARLISQGRLTWHEPLATQVDWPYATDAFSALGYRSGSQTGEIVPTYPPGLPLLMAAARTVGGEWAPFLVVPALGALLVLCTYRLGVMVSGPTPGAIGAALMTTSPVFLFQVVQPMSDVAAAALWTLTAVCALARRPAAAGAVAGMAVLVRPNLAPLWLAIGLACLRPVATTPRLKTGMTATGEATDTRPSARLQPGLIGSWMPGARAGLSTWLRFGAAFAVGVGVLAIVQWRLYDNPLSSGHGSVGDLFSPANIVPNVRDYARRLWRGEMATLALAALAAVLLVVARRDERVRGQLQPALGPFALVAAVLLVSYLPYGVFPDWSYLRFLMPALPFAFVVVGTLLVAAFQRLPRPVAGLSIIVALAAALAWNVTAAGREQAFDLQRYESRYRTTGRYLEASLPANAVIVTSQESTGAQYYTGLPVVHWDLLFAELDAAIATLQAIGRAPVLVVEDWETRDLRTRFQASTAARLDWLPRAEIGETTRVRLYDPADRTRADVITDRIR